MIGGFGREESFLERKGEKFGAVLVGKIRVRVGQPDWDRRTPEAEPGYETF